MARANSLLTEEDIKAGIESYTGYPVCDVKRVHDPKVAGSMAIRCKIAPGRASSGEQLDFLIGGDAPALKTPEDIAEHLEECEFETWPPRSGGLRFF